MSRMFPTKKEIRNRNIAEAIFIIIIIAWVIAAFIAFTKGGFAVKDSKPTPPRIEDTWTNSY